MKALAPSYRVWREEGLPILEVRRLLGNAGVWRPVVISAIYSRSLGSAMPNLIQIGRAVFPPGQVEENCRQTHMHIHYALCFTIVYGVL